MDFLQGFGKRVSDVAKTVGKRTAEATEIAKLNNKMTAVKEEEESLYRQIGKVYYATRGVEQEDALNMMCERIGFLQQEMVAITRQIDAVRNILRCPSCNEEQPENAIYCAKCGTKLVKFTKPEPEPEPPLEEPPLPEEETPQSPTQSPDVFINWPEAAKEEADENKAEEQEDA